VKKQQYLLVGGACILCILLYFFGNTIPPKNPSPPTASAQHNENQQIKFEELLAKAKEKLNPEQSLRITKLETSVIRGDVKEQQLHVYHQLARFWRDSARIFETYAYYTSEAAKLENSEKSLTFAAHLFLENLMTEGQPAMQYWLASNAKVLFEKAIAMNPGNDSSKIGLGACYIFGNISDNPMQGIIPVRDVVQKNPDNIFGQMVLALGGKKSGQYDKAIERFNIIVQKQPDNIEAVFNLAECYDLKGDKPNAITWYSAAKKLVKVPEAQKELDKRITELRK
jgi:tetratricopeptide (TPR) repeat protein